MAEISVRKKEILTLAAQLFRTKGYHAASMRDIAKAASIQVSTLYSHFANKEDILKAICTLVIPELSATPNKLTEMVAVKIKFKHLLQKHIRYAVSHPDYYLVCMQDWKQLQGDNLIQQQNNWKKYCSQFMDLLSEAKQKNKIRKLDPQQIMYACFGAIQLNCQNINLTQPDKINLTKQLTKLLMNGIFKK